MLSSIVLEVPASASVELRFKRKAVDTPPLPAAEHVHVAHVLRPLYFLDVSVAAPFVIGGKRKVSSRVVPDLDKSVLTLEEDLRVSPAVMLHVFPGGRRLGAISSFSSDRVCVRMEAADVKLADARTKRDAEKVSRDQALLVLDQVNSELNKAREKLKDADDELAGAAIERDQDQAALNEALVEFETAKAGLKAAQTKLDGTKQSKARKSAEAELEVARAKVEKAENDKDAAEVSLREASDALTNATADQKTAQRQVSDWEGRLAPAQRDRDAAQNPLDHAEADLTAAEAKRCQHLRRARYAANSLGLQLGVGLDLSKFGDEFYSGLFFEPVTGLNLGVGMAIIKGDQLNPGYAVGQVVDPTQLGPYASERYMIRPYVGISVSFDIIRNIRAASKAPEVTKLENG
ncbi:hypothetical protein [Enhygromyxa salina]|uniref:hypothetical protein n=1 Tax=Enhygromyxa salina TaxID=215803 RepID=UPI0011B25D49|nr:hypothetical protein [Enhygromyxa salina]